MDFKILLDLVQIITRNKIKNIEIIGNADQTDNLVKRLYDGILKGTITSDETAIVYLYGNTNTKIATYQQLKNRLAKQLTNTSFFIDVNQPSYNDRAKAYYNCYRDFAAAFIIMLRGSNKASKYLMEKALAKSIKYEFTELSAEIARNLRHYTSRTTSDQKQHKRFADLHRKYEKQRRLEMQALEYYEELVEYYLTYRSPNQRIKSLADTYFDELSPLSIHADTSRFHFYFYQIESIKFISVNDFHSAFNTVEKALIVLESRENTNRTMIQSVLIQKLSCLTALKIFGDAGENVVEHFFSLSTNTDSNNLQIFIPYFYYLNYQGKYFEALQILEKVSKLATFTQFSGVYRDNWLLFGGYLHLLAALGKLDAMQVESIVGPFRYGKLVNEIKVIDKDREGMNIPLILLPILFNLAHENNPPTDWSTEALAKYRQRYLDTEMNQRSATFASMLILQDKKESKSLDAAERIKKGFAELKEEKPKTGGQNFAIEIVPYEDLWEMLNQKIEGK